VRGRASGEWSYQDYHDSTKDIDVAIENSKRIDKISNKLITLRVKL